ncbi:hypothetical protein PR048_005435 [Dryococelus australis]|uniref:Uncharacterized protein n=1 Tax=Dryococelus australis TaxID=614101 RepID=A0ABQ9I988_9NEOP|nr:hypothetical protein PR048_005435 [Dryococelus australis]
MTASSSAESCDSDSLHPIDCSAEDCGRFRRKFQLMWLDAFNWLAYCVLKEGAFCKYCVLYLNSEFAAKCCHEAVGQLVSRSSKKLKDALQIFRNNEKSNYPKKCILAAENICEQRRKDAAKNREKLVPIIQTICLCGRQQLPLRKHNDTGRIMLNEPDNNDGNFRSFEVQSKQLRQLIERTLANQ